MTKARVFVTLKKSVQDPQGAVVRHALESLSFKGVSDVRVGKLVELSFTGNRAEAEAQLKDMCEKLLANTVIEDYRWEIAA